MSKIDTEKNQPKYFGKRSEQNLANIRKNHDRLQDDILVALSLLPQMVFVWPHPTGAAYRDGQLIRYGLLGSADIIGLVKGGKFVAIEVKTGRGIQEPQQRTFEAKVKVMGGQYFVARSVDDAVQFVSSVAASANVE